MAKRQPPQKRKARKQEPSTKATGTVTLGRILRDIESLRRAVRDDVRGLDRRITTLEDADGYHRKAIEQIGVSLKDLDAEVKNMHAEIRVLNANSRTTLGAIETMLAVRESLARIESRLP